MDTLWRRRRSGYIVASYMTEYPAWIADDESSKWPDRVPSRVYFRCADVPQLDGSAPGASAHSISTVGTLCASSADSDGMNSLAWRCNHAACDRSPSIRQRQAAGIRIHGQPARVRTVRTATFTYPSRPPAPAACLCGCAWLARNQLASDAGVRDAPEPGPAAVRMTEIGERPAAGRSFLVRAMYTCGWAWDRVRACTERSGHRRAPVRAAPAKMKLVERRDANVAPYHR